MSIQGDGTRTLPFFTIRIEDSYSDDCGYDVYRTIKIDTLIGTFTIEPSLFRRLLRVVKSCFNKDERKYVKYSLPISYSRPDLGYYMSGDAESIRNAIQRNKEQDAKRAKFQKLSTDKQDAFLFQRELVSHAEARESYVRILRDVKRFEDAIIVEQGGYVDGVGPAEIRDLAREHYTSEVKFLTSEPTPTRR